MGGELPQECITENSPYESLKVTLWREREKICKDDHHTKGSESTGFIPGVGMTTYHE